MRTRQVWRDGGGAKTGFAPNCGLPARRRPGEGGRRVDLAQRREAAKPPSLSTLQRKPREFRIFGKILPSPCSPFTPVQVLWLRLAALCHCVKNRRALRILAAKERKEHRDKNLCCFFFALQSVRITHSRKDSQSTLLREKSKVRGMIVKGMGKSVFRFIPLTIIPLTSLRHFPSAIFHPPFGCGWPGWDLCDLLRQFSFGCGSPRRIFDRKNKFSL